jgi:hypothetical protein
MFICQRKYLRDIFMRMVCVTIGIELHLCRSIFLKPGKPRFVRKQFLIFVFGFNFLLKYKKIPPVFVYFPGLCIAFLYRLFNYNIQFQRTIYISCLTHQTCNMTHSATFSFLIRTLAPSSLTRRATWHTAPLLVSWSEH